MPKASSQEDMLSPAALRYAATHDEIYTYDHGRAVVEHFEHIARENTVELAQSSISNRNRPASSISNRDRPASSISNTDRQAEVKRARELRIVTEAFGAVEYAQWRLSLITDGTPRIYDVRDDADQHIRDIPPHIAVRLHMLDRQMMRRRMDVAPDHDNADKRWLRDYLNGLHNYSYVAPVHESIVEQIAMYGRRLSRMTLIPRKRDWEEQFVNDERDEILALYEWLRLVDVLQEYE